jgi:hypothetical protein
MPAIVETPAAAPKPRGRRPAAVTRAAAPAAGTVPDWLYHHLTISGPAEIVETFAVAARGAGVIPWQLDYADIEETVFHLAVSQPAGGRRLTVEGCHILARQFRERVEARQGRAAARVGHSFLCPFDLQVLLPVPAAILQLGPTHPTALAWMTAHWGMIDAPRQVTVRDKASTGRRLPKDHRVIGYGFFTAGETPQAAVDEIAACWPALRFWLMPRPAD